MFISKRKGGFYYLYFNSPVSNKRKKISTGTSKKAEALKFLKEFELKGFQESSEPTIKPLCLSELNKEILRYAKINYEANTCDLYSRSLKNLLLCLGERLIESLTLRDFENFKSFRVSQVSRTTVNMELRTIKASLFTAQRFGLIIKNPIQGVKQFTIPQKQKLAFNSEEIHILLKEITDNLIKRIALFGLYTGCRLSEILNVQIKDIDLDERVINILNKTDFKTKTGKIRNIPICDALYDLISAKCDCNIDNYLFSFDGVKRLNKDFVSQKFKKYLRKAKLPEKYHFHCLRHTFITNMIKSGVPINFVKELAGHSDIKTTMGYIHIEMDDLREAISHVKMAI